MLLRIGNEDFVSKEISYHSICRVNYQSRAEKTPLVLSMRRTHKHWMCQTMGHLGIFREIFTAKLLKESAALLMRIFSAKGKLFYLAILIANTRCCWQNMVGKIMKILGQIPPGSRKNCCSIIRNK